MSLAGYSPQDHKKSDPTERVHFHFQTNAERSNLQSEVAQSCPTLCNPMDCSLPGSSVHRIFQARVLIEGESKSTRILDHMDFISTPIYIGGIIISNIATLRIRYCVYIHFTDEETVIQKSQFPLLVHRHGNVLSCSWLHTLSLETLLKQFCVRDQTSPSSSNQVSNRDII